MGCTIPGRGVPRREQVITYGTVTYATVGYRNLYLRSSGAPAEPTSGDSGGHGHCRLLVAVGPGGIARRPAGRGLRHSTRRRPRPHPRRWRHRWAHAPGAGALPVPCDGAAGSGQLLHRGRTRGGQALPSASDAHHRSRPCGHRAQPVRQLRRGLAGQGGPRRRRRHQHAGEDPDRQRLRDPRGHAGRRRLRDHGRRRAARDPAVAHRVRLRPHRPPDDRCRRLHQGAPRLPRSR